MLIREGGKVRWDNGPLCDTEAEALKTAQSSCRSDDEQVFVMDSATTPSIDDDIFDMEDI